MLKHLTAATLLTVALGADTDGTSRAQTAPAQACRNAVTSATTQTKGLNGFTSTTTTECRYDKATNKSTCTNLYEDSMGTKSKTVAVTTFASLEQAIDEVKVVPPLKLSTRTDLSGTGSRGAIESTLLYTHDERRRLTQEVASSRQGSGYTMTYTEWDASGRPTAGSTTFIKGPTTSLKVAYDDATRTVTTTTGAGNQWVTCDMVYDADGNASSTSCRSPDGPSSASKTTTTATEKICR
jgi:hypothetical protein